MNLRSFKILTLLVACFMPLLGLTAIEPGVWTDAFTDAKAYAEKTHTPMLVFWGSPGCSQCGKLKTAMAKADFQEWMAKQQYVMVKCEGDSTADGKQCHSWAKNSSGAFPYVVLYWPKSDGTTVLERFSGRSGSMPVKGGTLQSQLMKSAEQAFAGWSVSKDDEISFVVTDGAYDRLEAVIGETTSVDVPLKRSYATEGRKCSVKAIYPDGTIKENAVVWGTESTRVVAVEIPVVNDLAKKDAAIKLILTADESSNVSTSAIHFVTAPENSSANPHWIGERTAEDLDWGEWTMDLDVATQKVAAAEGSAYTLILVGGSKWCPDCVNVDRWLLDQAAFRDWAKKRNVVCVNIDIPCVSGEGTTGLTTYPSLLAYDNYSVSDRYVSAMGEGESARVQSGAAYLSRHGIAQEDAEAVSARNATLFSTSTLEGGLCRPDCVATDNAETGKFKTGVPCLIVMDKTGRIIGRNFQFNNESPTTFDDAYITRLDELLAQESELAEEANDSWQTTTETIPLMGNTGVATETADLRKSISYSDTKDWYRVDASAKGSKLQYRLTGDVDAEVSLTVVQVSSKTVLTLKSVKGSLKEGIALDIEAIPSTNCYVKVSAPLTPEQAWGVTTGYFALTNEASTVAKYVLSCAGILQPSEIEQTYDLPDGALPEVPVNVIAGKVYKFAGNDGYDDSQFDYTPDADIYVAKVSEAVNMKLKGQTLTYQIWNTGSVVFEKTSGSVSEPKSGYETHKIVVRRTGGSSSVAKVRVTVDASGSTKLEGIYEFAQDGETLEWAEGESEDKEVAVRVLANDFADGTQKVILKLTAVEGTVAGIGEESAYELTIVDDDAPNAGKIEILSVSPAKAGKTVYAKAGSEVEIALARTGGSDGALGVSLTSSAGQFDVSAFAWETRHTETKTAKLSLADVAAGKTVTVQLVPDEGSSVVSSSRTFSIAVVAADAPSFDPSAVAYTVYRRVSCEEYDGVGVDAGDATDVKVSKIAGQVPSGITFGYDADCGALVFHGAPTASAGTYVAYFQVSAGKTKGTTACVTFTVIDPTKALPETGEPLNASCAKSRTFSDLQVYRDESFSRLTGLMTLTISSSAKLSAKYVTAEDSISFSAKSWSSIDGEGVLHARLTGTRDETKDCTLDVAAYPDGTLTCQLTDRDGKKLTVLCEDENWKELTSGAADFEGYYTASLAQRQATDGLILAKGDGYLTLKMTGSSAIKKGKMAFAGLLPNGKTFSGSRTLWGYEDTELESVAFAGLPVFVTSKENSVAGLAYIKPEAKENHISDRYSVSSGAVDYGFDTALVWNCKEAEKVNLSYEAEFDIYGGYYNPDEDFAGCCISTFETETLTFFAMPDMVDDDATWATNDTSVSAAQVKGKNALTLLTPKNVQKLTLSFNQKTGIVSGTMNLTLSTGTVKATYKGVVLPGWGSAACEQCGEVTGTQLRPFVSGGCWFAQKGQYEIDGQSKSVSLTYGCPFSIGVEEGK